MLPPEKKIRKKFEVLKCVLEALTPSSSHSGKKRFNACQSCLNESSTLNTKQSFINKISKYMVVGGQVLLSRCINSIISNH